MYVLQLLNYVRPYGNQSNATDSACGTNVREEKFFERLVERDYLLDLSVLKNCDESLLFPEVLFFYALNIQRFSLCVCVCVCVF